ncbi:MAG TPA: zf-HC2 domain-containing protein [Spirochaetota bacterium]|nr:zf-HC2 domain-containing protein [Spirochaetota bacterium]HPS86556.1 zf-HC2 domain-containing protein [Spirochaetota bacterium]
MKCRDAHEMINSYFDNKIDPMKDKHLAEHINSCPKCRAELNFLIEYRNILKTVKPVSPPDNYMTELHRRIELEKPENPLRKISGTLRIFLSNYNFHIEAAGVLAVAALVFFLYRPFFSEKIPEKTSEYGIISQRSGTAVEKNIHKEYDKPDKTAESKNVPSVNKESSKDREILKDKTPVYEAADDNLSAEKKNGYDSGGISLMKKSLSRESEKSMIKSEGKVYVAEKTDTGGAVSREEDSAQTPVNDAENLFAEYNVSVIKKDLSRSDGLYYKVKVNSNMYPSLIKKLKENYIVEEKILNKNKVYCEIEIFLKKEKK